MNGGRATTKPEVKALANASNSLKAAFEAAEKAKAAAQAAKEAAARFKNLAKLSTDRIAEQNKQPPVNIPRGNVFLRRMVMIHFYHLFQKDEQEQSRHEFFTYWQAFRDWFVSKLKWPYGLDESVLIDVLDKAGMRPNEVERYRKYDSTYNPYLILVLCERLRKIEEKALSKRTKEEHARYVGDINRAYQSSLEKLEEARKKIASDIEIYGTGRAARWFNSIAVMGTVSNGFPFGLSDTDLAELGLLMQEFKIPVSSIISAGKGIDDLLEQLKSGQERWLKRIKEGKPVPDAASQANPPRSISEACEQDELHFLHGVYDFFRYELPYAYRETYRNIKGFISKELSFVTPGKVEDFNDEDKLLADNDDYEEIKDSKYDNGATVVHMFVDQRPSFDKLKYWTINYFEKSISCTRVGQMSPDDIAEANRELADIDSKVEEANNNAAAQEQSSRYSIFQNNEFMSLEPSDKPFDPFKTQFWNVTKHGASYSISRKRRVWFSDVKEQAGKEFAQIMSLLPNAYLEPPRREESSNQLTQTLTQVGNSASDRKEQKDEKEKKEQKLEAEIKDQKPSEQERSSQEVNEQGQMYQALSEAWDAKMAEILAKTNKVGLIIKDTKAAKQKPTLPVQENKDHDDTTLFATVVLERLRGLRALKIGEDEKTAARENIAFEVTRQFQGLPQISFFSPDFRVYKNMIKDGPGIIKHVAGRTIDTIMDISVEFDYPFGVYDEAETVVDKATRLVTWSSRAHQKLDKLVQRLGLSLAHVKELDVDTFYELLDQAFQDWLEGNRKDEAKDAKIVKPNKLNATRVAESTDFKILKLTSERPPSYGGVDSDDTEAEAQSEEKTYSSTMLSVCDSKENEERELNLRYSNRDQRLGAPSSYGTSRIPGDKDDIRDLTPLFIQVLKCQRDAFRKWGARTFRAQQYVADNFSDFLAFINVDRLVYILNDSVDEYPFGFSDDENKSPKDFLRIHFGFYRNTNKKLDSLMTALHVDMKTVRELKMGLGGFITVLEDTWRRHQSAAGQSTQAAAVERKLDTSQEQKLSYHDQQGAQTSYLDGVGIHRNDDPDSQFFSEDGTQSFADNRAMQGVFRGKGYDERKNSDTSFNAFSNAFSVSKSDESAEEQFLKESKGYFTSGRYFGSLNGRHKAPSPWQDEHTPSSSTSHINAGLPSVTSTASSASAPSSRILQHSAQQTTWQVVEPNGGSMAGEFFRELTGQVLQGVEKIFDETIFAGPSVPVQQQSRTHTNGRR